MIGRIVRIAGASYEVRSGDQSLVSTFRGKLRQEKREATRLAAVGDEVEVTARGSGEGVIEKVLPRKSKLSRSDPGDDRREQVIVANPDMVLIVQAAVDPGLDLLTIDKCTVMAQASGVPSFICVNKTDLGSPEEAGQYPSIGFPVFRTCAIQGHGIDALRKCMMGKTTVLLGPSGVGKSSLVNALLPGSDLKTGAVSEKTGGGKHTTTWIELVEIAKDTYVADTPGLEIFSHWGVTPDNLKDFFPDFVDVGEKCKFRDCRHFSEPKCAVLDALKKGKLLKTRYESYKRLHEILVARKDLF